MNPISLRTRRTFHLGFRSGFAVIAVSKRQFRISTAGLFCRGFFALALVCSALTLAMAVDAPAQEQDFTALQAETKKVFEDRVTPFFKSYCTDCHGIHRMEGGINFAPTLTAPGATVFDQNVEASAGQYQGTRHAAGRCEECSRPMRSGRCSSTGWERSNSSARRIQALFVIRRLTKMEYGNTLHDLFGVDPAIAAELPDEVFGEGYLNTLSPLQSEQYLAIANEVLDRILAPKDQPPTEMQKRLFGETPAPGSDLRDGGERRSPADWPETPIVDLRRRRNWICCCGSSICAGKQTRLPGVAALDAQGGPRFSAVPFHHSGEGAGSGAGHRSAR